MKGCPLSCAWCHNPEGISPKQQKMYTKRKCISCKRCIINCPKKALTLTPDGINSDKAICNLCGYCATVCPSLAIEMSGKNYSVEQLMTIIEKERIFMQHSGGGVTFSGGEPLFFPEKLKELLALCRKINVHSAVDTSLYANKETIETIIDETDLFLIDIKHFDSEKHHHWCGVPNELILSNIRTIANAGKDFIIRLPLIEGINADDENITQVALFLASLPWQRKEVNILPYHATALTKHIKLGTNSPLFTAPSFACQQHCIELFTRHDITATIGR